MILCNVQIQQALDDGRLVINPEPGPRKPEVAGGHCPYDTHAVDLTLSAEIVVPSARDISVIDLTRAGNIARDIEAHSKTFIASKEMPYQFNPNTFVLAKTAETITLPIKEDCETCLGARIEGKSSRARFGVLIHFTAPTVHPGFHGTLTLEMINLGPNPLLLVPGMAIAQLIVEEVRGCPFWNPSSFQGQSTAAGVSGNGAVAVKA